MDQSNGKSQKPDYGDGPLEKYYREQMTQLAHFIDMMLNGQKAGKPGERETAFVLMVFPFGEQRQGRCNYISNGVNRGDVVKLMEEQILRFKGLYKEPEANQDAKT
jgi:hypothetical protein